MEKAGVQEHVIGIPVSNRAFGIEEPEFPSEGATTYHGDAKCSTANARSSGKSGRTTGDKFAKGIKEHGESFSNLSGVTIFSLFLPVHMELQLRIRH